MAPKQDQPRRVAESLLDEVGQHAQLLASVRAINLRSEGDYLNAAYWDRVAAVLAEIQGRAPKDRYH